MATSDVRSPRFGFLLGFVLGAAVVGVPLLWLLFTRRPDVREVRVSVPTPASSKSDPSRRRRARIRADDESRVVLAAGDAGGEAEGVGTGEPAGAERSPSTGDAKVEPAANGGEPDERDERDRYEQEERELVATLADRLKLSVLDAETLEPLGGVEVRVFLGTGRNGGISSAGRTGADGKVAVNPRGLHSAMRVHGGFPEGVRVPLGTPENPYRADVTIRLPGYRPYLGRATGEELAVRLQPDREGWTFGSLRGRILGVDGVPWTFPFELGMQDPGLLDWIGFRVVPGRDGWFHVPGIPPGEWGVKISTGWGATTLVRVPPGGSANVDLRMNETPSETESTLGGLPESRRAVWVWVGRDLPRGGVVRIEGTWDGALVAEITNGVASFPEVPLGDARVFLVRPGIASESATLRVGKGAGILEFTFSRDG